MRPARVHKSQTPEALKVELAKSLEQRYVPPKFLYASPRQSELWLELHQQCAPTAALGAPYLKAAPYLPKEIQSLVSLGCGGGEKEISILQAIDRDIEFIPTDVSEPLVKAATQAAIAGGVCTGTPLVFDLAAANDAAEFLSAHAKHSCLFTFFGIIPNFPQPSILPRVRSLMNKDDHLLASANLSPHGMKDILPQYDNLPTRRWLEQFLTEHEITGGKLQINICGQNNLEWFQADYVFESDTTISMDKWCIEYKTGDALQMFVSHRYTPETAAAVFAEYGLHIERTFLSENREEGVFMCRPQ